MATFAGLGCSASADERDSLAGYEQFRFGMSPTELHSILSLSSRETEELGGAARRLFALHPVEIEGAEFGLSFLFVDGRLFRVDLRDPPTSVLIGGSGGNADDAPCTATFDRLRAHLEGEIGPPDAPPQRTEIRVPGETMTITTTEVAFSYRDGGTVELSTAFSSICGVSLSFTAGDDWPAVARP